MRFVMKPDKQTREEERDYAFIPQEEPSDNSYLFKLIFGVLVAFFIGALLGESALYLLQ